MIPERGLYTGIAIVGAIGTEKTSGCLYPYAEQILAYRHEDAHRRGGGLILEVKGDFCRKVRKILTDYGREGDYIELSLDSSYRYNPLHNELEAYALAYGIASLLNNLYGRGKEPFWQQAYTNLAGLFESCLVGRLCMHPPHSRAYPYSNWTAAPSTPVVECLAS